MDILIHIILICIIAALFFIYKFHSSQNPMLFVILITVLGIVFLYQDSTYITTGYNTTAVYNYTTHTATSETYPIQTPFAFEWALYLSYMALFFLGVINLTTGEEYNTNKEK